MKRVLLLAAVLVVSAGESAENGRVVGGEDASILEAPYQVSLRYKNKHHCGASILSENYIMTAAHCAEYNMLLYSVRSGSNRRLLGGTLHRVLKMHLHEDYHQVKRVPVNDIAVLRVIPAFVLDETRRPVALPSQGQVSLDGTLATVTGWGATKEDGKLPLVLQKVQLPLVNREFCNRQLANQVHEKQICAGFLQGGKDSCQGDSGGPLVSSGVQIGVVSWGWGCAAPKYPGVYTEVSAYRDWIKSKTGL